MKNSSVPKILQCTHFKHKLSGRHSRNVKDYEFDFYLNGERDMYIDGKHHKISAGTLVFRKPGQFVESFGDYDAYMLTLDFSGKLNIPPDNYLRHRMSPMQEECIHSVFDNFPEVFIPDHQDDIKRIFKNILDCSYPNIINTTLQDNLIQELLFLILHDAYKYNRHISKESDAKTNYIEAACKYINKNYSDNITLDKLSAYLALNKNYLIRLFKKELNTTPNTYILETRLFYARIMIIQTRLSITEISYACGFNTPSYFIKCFKKHYGVSPKVYKKQHTQIEST